MRRFSTLVIECCLTFFCVQDSDKISRKKFYFYKQLWKIILDTQTGVTCVSISDTIPNRVIIATNSINLHRQRPKWGILKVLSRGYSNKFRTCSDALLYLLYKHKFLFKKSQFPSPSWNFYAMLSTASFLLLAYFFYSFLFRNDGMTAINGEVGKKEKSFFV